MADLEFSEELIFEPMRGDAAVFWRNLAVRWDEIIVGFWRILVTVPADIFEDLGLYAFVVRLSLVEVKATS